MNTRLIPMITKQWLTVILILALPMWSGVAGATGADDEQLIRVANSGDSTLVKELLEKGVPVNAKDRNGQTALIAAVLGGHTQTIKLLLQKGADVNARDIGGGTPLIWAVWEGRLEVVEVLLERGVDVNSKSFGGRTALMQAAARDHQLENWYSVLRTFFRSILHWSFFGPRYPVGEKDAQMVKVLLEKGADVNAKYKDGWTALMRAQYRGATEIVGLLKAAGATE